MRGARAVAVAVLALVAGCSDDDDAGDTGADSTTTTAAAPALALAATGLGPISIGMSTADVEATGLVRDFESTCEIVTNDLEAADLRAPLAGRVFAQAGAVAWISVREGAVIEPGGGRPEATVDDFVASFPEPFDVVVDTSVEEMFGSWFVRVTDGDGNERFGATVDVDTERIHDIWTPGVLVCD